MPETIDADVCVVGAGYAGLTAARRLDQAGISVVVLEARERVGGRIWSQQRDGGTVLDRGGAWLAPYHDAIFGLADEVRATTYKTWVKGAHIQVGEDRTRRYTGLIPKISPVAVLAIAVAQARVNRMAKRLPLEAPWTAAHAAEWDERTVAWFLDRSRIRNPSGRRLFEMAVRGLFAADSEQVSFLDLLMLVRGHGGIDRLFSIDGGAQENLVDGGAGVVAQRVADALGDAVRLRTPARSISQRDDRVTVTADSVAVTARFAIVAIPPALTVEIDFSPALPDDRAALYRSAVGGTEAKTLLVYDTPFWRADGLSGQTSEPGSVAEVTLDATPSTGRPGVIASFTFGPVAQQVHQLDPAARRRAVTEAMRARLGPRAGAPVDFVETAWWTEPWSRGCSVAHLPPGVLTRYGHLLREPLGRVHWAGTETATVSHGAIDGAVRSGARAAAEILERLG